MELFSLLAKLTLDKKDFDRKMEEAQRSADSFTMPDDQSLELDTRDYRDNLDEAEEESISFGNIVGEVFKNLKGVIVGLGIAGVVSGIVSNLKEGVELAKNHGDLIDKQSKKMNLSAKAYQEWDYALKLSGASIEDLNRGMRNWQSAIGNEDKTAELGEAFAALGIDAEAAFKKIESGENLDSLLNDTLYALADMEPGQRGLIGQALFGSKWNELNPLLDNTAQQIREMKEDANDFGLIMSDEEIKNAAEYADATSRLEQALNGIKEAFAADVIPLLTDAANTVAAIVAFFNPRLKGMSLSDMLGDKDNKFAEEIVTIEGTATAAESLADKLLAMGDTSKLTAEQYAIWKGTAQELINLVPSLSEVIDLETGTITANSAEIRENIKQWEAMAKQKALQTLKEEKYAAIMEKNKELVDKTVEANVKAAEAEGKRGEAIDKVNKVLEKAGIGPLGAEATAEEIGKAQASAILAYQGDEYGAGQYAIELGEAVSEFSKASQEAANADKEVQSLTAELEKGKQEYEAWLTAAETMYGGLDSDAESATAQAQALKDTIDSIPSEKRIFLDVQSGRVQPFAIGSAYIPYDNFPALLHRGEQVLTATEARKGNGSSVDLGNLEDRIEAAIRRGMEGVTVDSYINGRSVTDDVNRNTARQLKSRRFAP